MCEIYSLLSDVVGVVVGKSLDIDENVAGMRPDVSFQVCIVDETETAFMVTFWGDHARFVFIHLSIFL